MADNGFRPAQTRLRDEKGRFIAQPAAPKKAESKVAPKPTLREKLRKKFGRTK